MHLTDTNSVTIPQHRRKKKRKNIKAKPSLEGTTAWKEQHPGRNNSLEGTTAWKEQQPGRNNILEAVTILLQTLSHFSIFQRKAMCV
jgi:hypothetical protein